MPKKNRLTGVEIRGLRSPRRAHGGLFSISTGPSRSGGTLFACVVSKKVAAKAVERNRIKRRCRAILQQLKGLPAGSYILYAKKGAATATYREIEKDVSALMRSLRSA